MWFLRMDFLGLLTALCGCLFVVRQCAGRDKRPVWAGFLLAGLQLAALAYIDLGLCLFYAFYVLFTFVWIRLLCRINTAPLLRRIVFATGITLFIIPLLIVRLTSFSFLQGVVLIGFAYQMLKAVDGLFYVYYAGETVAFLPYVNFLLFLPTFTSGPILRYRDFLAGYQTPLQNTPPQTVEAVKRIIRGLFKKIVLSAFALQLFHHLVAQPARLPISVLAVAASYAVLFFDFSGYSDIAIGFGRLMGFAVPENFKKPLEAASFTQFWRNWHVTLSDWIREHIFVALLGQKLNRRQSALIGFCTMVVMSLWHGFSWLYLAAGVYMGLLLALENALGLTSPHKRKMKKPVYIARCAAVNFLFGVNTLAFLLDGPQLLHVLKGFVRM